MASMKQVKNEKLYWGRIFAAVFALLIAATHIMGGGGGGQSSFPSSGSGNYVAQQSTGSTSFILTGSMGLWLNIEVITYTLIAVVFILGLRSLYLAATIFNAFNLGIYLLSGLTAIPTITSSAYSSHLSIPATLSSTILMISWIALLVLSILMLKHDSGSGIDKLLKD